MAGPEEGECSETNEQFLKACRDGDISTFNSLLNLADVNHVSESMHGVKYTPLGISIVFNHQDIALRLLGDKRIDVNKKTCESTALHYAALRNNVVLIETICSKDGVLHNQKDYLNDGVTPLAVAVKHKNVEAVRALVKVREVDIDPLDSEGHSLDFLVKRVENTRNAEILYILDSARKQRMEESVDSSSSWFSWLGLSSSRKEEDEEKKRKEELHQRELFELQALKEAEEVARRQVLEKSLNSLLDSVERKREELSSKENVLKELKIIHDREKREMEEEFKEKEKLMNEKHLRETEMILSDKDRLCEELVSLEQKLEELMARQTANLVGEEGEKNLPCPECPVCLELLLPPIRIMQCSNGHLVCAECEGKPELTCCPTCRQSFTGRATAMEQHLANLFT